MMRQGLLAILVCGWCVVMEVLASCSQCTGVNCNSKTVSSSYTLSFSSSYVSSSCTVEVAATDSSSFKLYLMDAANAALQNAGSAFQYKTAFSSDSDVNCFSNTGSVILTGPTLTIICTNFILDCPLLVEFTCVGAGPPPPPSCSQCSGTNCVSKSVSAGATFTSTFASSFISSSCTLNVASTDGSSFTAYTMDAANFAKQQSGAQFTYKTAFSSASAVTCLSNSGSLSLTGPALVVICQNSFFSCPLLVLFTCIGTTTSVAPAAPPATGNAAASCCDATVDYYCNKGGYCSSDASSCDSICKQIGGTGCYSCPGSTPVPTLNPQLCSMQMTCDSCVAATGKLPSPYNALLSQFCYWSASANTCCDNPNVNTLVCASGSWSTACPTTTIPRTGNPTTVALPTAAPTTAVPTTAVPTTATPTTPVPPSPKDQGSSSSSSSSLLFIGVVILMGAVVLLVAGFAVYWFKCRAAASAPPPQLPLSGLEKPIMMHTITPENTRQTASSPSNQLRPAPFPQQKTLSPTDEDNL